MSKNLDSRMLSLIIPAYNEASHNYLEKTIKDAQARSEVTRIIVISDGSTDDTVEKVFALKKSCPKLEILSYTKNKGKEGAVKSALRYLSDSIDLKNPGSYIGLIDSDGQHKVKDTIRMYHEAINKKVDFVGGYRDFNGQGIPLDRKIANRCTEFVIRYLGGMPTRDLLFGQKVFHAKYTNMLARDLDSKGRYKIEPSLTSKLLWKGASYSEIPVKAEYRACSKKSGMGLKNTRWLKQTAYLFRMALQNRLKKT